MNNDTNEINLLNVLALLMRHGRPILIFTLVMGLVLALCGGISIIVTDSLPQQTQRELQKAEFEKMAQDKLEEQLGTVEKTWLEQNQSIAELQTQKFSLEQQIVGLSKSLDQQKLYNENSVKMSISSDQVAYEESYFAVVLVDRPADEDAELNISLTNQITGAYVNFLWSDDLANQMMARLPVFSDSSFVTELLNISQISTSVIKAQVTAADAETAKQMMDLLVDYASQCKNSMDSSLAKHTFSLIQRNSFENGSLSLAQSQQDSLDAETNLENQLKDAQNQLVQCENAIRIGQKNMDRNAETIADIQEELDIREGIGDAEHGSVIASKMKTPAKYAIIGLVAGLFVAICWYVVKYMILQNETFADEVMRSCSAPYMGNLTLEQKHTRFEQLLQKDTVDPMLAMPQEDRWKIVAENVLIAVRNLEPGKVVMTGTASRTSLEKICQYMAQQKTGFEFIPATLPSITPGSASLILDSKAVFYVVCPGKTSMSLMKDGLESLKNLDREPVGLLLV